MGCLKDLQTLAIDCDCAPRGLRDSDFVFRGLIAAARHDPLALAQLREISLSEIDLSGPRAASLVRALQGCTLLKLLSLVSCKIEEPGLQAIARGLKAFPALEQLNLSKNLQFYDMDDGKLLEACDALSYALAQHGSLECLQMSKCAIDPKVLFGVPLQTSVLHSLVINNVVCSSKAVLPLLAAWAGPGLRELTICTHVLNAAPQAAAVLIGRLSKLTVRDLDEPFPSICTSYRTLKAGVLATVTAAAASSTTLVDLALNRFDDPGDGTELIALHFARANLVISLNFISTRGTYLTRRLELARRILCARKATRKFRCFGHPLTKPDEKVDPNKCLRDAIGLRDAYLCRKAVELGACLTAGPQVALIVDASEDVETNIYIGKPVLSSNPSPVHRRIGYPDVLVCL
eukprot:m.200237 g.200237  ORF g.200237 m.200237 type:complete len:404 (+) comp10100_c0_seq30:4373-5584(+)